MTNILKKSALALVAATMLAAPAFADTVKLRMSTPASDTDQRTVALANIFAPAVADFRDL